MAVPPREEIVRAICTNECDGERIHSSLFKGENTSVSRLAIIPLADHWDMFRRHVQKPPERLLTMIGQIKVERLQSVGRCFETPVELTVEPDPLDWNPAHAVIPQKIGRGLAKKIIAALELHKPPHTV